MGKPECGGRLEFAQLNRHSNGVCPAGRSEAPLALTQMKAHGAVGDAEPSRDDLVCAAFCRQCEDLALTFGQATSCHSCADSTPPANEPPARSLIDRFPILTVQFCLFAT
jgi:hypothetical protein